MSTDNPIMVNNKKVCKKVREFRDLLSKKTGKEVPLTTAISVMFEDENIISKISDAKIKKQNRSKNKYVFEM